MTTEICRIQEFTVPIAPIPLSFSLFFLQIVNFIHGNTNKNYSQNINSSILQKPQTFYFSDIETKFAYTRSIFLCNFEQWAFQSVSGWDKRYCFLGSAFQSTSHSAYHGHFQGGKGCEDEAAPLKSWLLYLPPPLGLVGITALSEGSIHYSYIVVKTFKGSSDLEGILHMLHPGIFPLYTTVLFMVNSAFTLVLLCLDKSLAATK